ncbi:MAG: nuclear transport factor 2 family protein [Nitrospinota bacterium]|nr:nuclear transport factor 2 family protein [Nitrospinota bacterium]
MLANWADGGILIYPGKGSASGRFEGKEAIGKWWENTFEYFPELKFTVNHVLVENVFDFMGTNVIAVSCDIKARNRHGVEFETCAVNLMKIRKRKIVEARYFFFSSREEIDMIASR